MGFIRVIEPGMLTTVQDLGRAGFAAMGVPVGGAADAVSLRVGNRLVGNEEGAAALELTLVGGVLEFEESSEVVVVGGEVEARVEGDQPVESGVAVRVAKGRRLRIGPVRRGCRVYLCVQGGVDVEPVMGSASTLLTARLGGVEGRALRAGDRVRAGKRHRGGDEGTPSHGPLPSKNETKLRSAALIREVLERRRLRIVLGAGFSEAARGTLLANEYGVLAQSDRVGLRLHGAALTAPDRGRMISEGMMCGAVQVPENGEPIVLMADHPTTGGYPVIGCIAAADLPTLGQLRPGDQVRFESIDVETARAILRERERRVEEIMQFD